MELGDSGGVGISTSGSVNGRSDMDMSRDLVVSLDDCLVFWLRVVESVPSEISKSLSLEFDLWAPAELEYSCLSGDPGAVGGCAVFHKLLT